MTKQTTPMVFITEDKLGATIKTIKASGTKLDALIQHAALSAVKIASKPAAGLEGTGNIFYVNELYRNMPKGARHVAMTSWLLEFGGLKANNDKDKKDKPFIHDSEKTVDLEGGQKTPWFDMKPSKSPDEVLDILALTLAVLKKAAKDGAQLAHAEMIPELQALVERFTPASDVLEASEE